MESKTIILEEPNEKQKRFLLSDKKYVGFGGARGGGKSWVVRTKSILLCLTHPALKVCIVRRTYPELTVNHINIMRQMLAGIVRYNDRDKIMTFPNGSTIQYRYCALTGDLTSFQGCEYDAMFFDEATNFPKEHIDQMLACLRGASAFRRRAYFTANPGSVGHQWFKQWFIDKVYERGENPDDFEFIQSLVTDNSALMENDPSYKKQLEMLPERLKKAWLYGEWDVFEGVFFEEFRDNKEGYQSRKWTHVIEPFDIPETWNVYRSYDYGYSKPFAFCWFAVSPDETVYHIAELYGCTGEANVGVKWTADEQFAKAHEMEMQHPLLKGRQISGVADPAIFHADGGESIYECALRHQIYFTPGDNKRIQGWNQFHTRLSFDANGRAMFYVFNTCKNFIRTIPLLQYSQTHVEDLDTSMEDHIADSVRYFLMSRAIAPRESAVHREIKDDPLNMFTEQKPSAETNVYRYNF